MPEYYVEINAGEGTKVETSTIDYGSGDIRHTQQFVPGGRSTVLSPVLARTSSDAGTSMMNIIGEANLILAIHATEVGMEYEIMFYDRYKSGLGSSGRMGVVDLVDFNPFDQTEPWTPAISTDINTVVLGGSPNHVYVCTTAGTTHATTEPTWPLSKNSEVTDGTVTWLDFGEYSRLYATPMIVIPNIVGAVYYKILIINPSGDIMIFGTGTEVIP